MQALCGLLLAMFIASLTATIMSTALPRMVADIGGSQGSSTWVITATLLTTTISIPIWGKLADLFNKKLMLQTAAVIFSVGSLAAGLSQNMGELIGARALQGIGAGGLQSLVQISIGAIIPPRERGKYAGYQASATAVATIGGPLLGGLIVDTAWLGWRWCFFISLPVAAIALVILQRTLHLPRMRKGNVKIDYLGATLVSAGVSLLLIWVSFVDDAFAWASWPTAVMVGGSIVILTLALWVEARVEEPLVPLEILMQRPVILAIVGSLAAGTAMFGVSVFLSQYFQIARGHTPTEAGLLAIPMMVGILVASLIGGHMLSRKGYIKPYLMVGSIMLTLGLAGLGMSGTTTSLLFVSAAMILIGAGIGLTGQNFTLLVQNSVAQRDLGAATSTVSFFRSLGGTIGVAVLGAILARQVDNRTGPATDPQEVFAAAVGFLFYVAAAISLVGVFAVIALKPVRLRTTLDLTDRIEAAAIGTEIADGAAIVDVDRHRGSSDPEGPDGTGDVAEDDDPAPEPSRG